MAKITKPFSRRLLTQLTSPFAKFAQMEASSGLLLLAVTLVALFWANSPWRDSYASLLHTPLALTVGDFHLSHTLHHWINDGLMVVFFFVVGLEIKRELILGELSDKRRAALPMIAALGGMIAPAVIYSLFNWQGEGHAGWGIPMATDIAFAVGVLALFSKRVPFALKIFLLALAIVDDLGAVLVIAFFYTQKISTHALVLAGVGLLLVRFLRQAEVRPFWIYWLIGIFVWYQILLSGVHATIAGVALGLMTPVHALEGDTSSPLDILVQQLHSMVSFVIMPVFALANAGVELSISHEHPILSHPITQGIVLGLLVGKPLGVILFSWLAVKLNWASLPKGVNWKHMSAAGLLAGIGFTMALFISNLALKTPELEIFSKSGILLGSAASALVGVVVLLLLPNIKST